MSVEQYIDIYKKVSKHYNGFNFTFGSETKPEIVIDYFTSDPTFLNANKNKLKNELSYLYVDKENRKMEKFTNILSVSIPKESEYIFQLNKSKTEDKLFEYYYSRNILDDTEDDKIIKSSNPFNLYNEYKITVKDFTYEPVDDVLINILYDKINNPYSKKTF